MVDKILADIANQIAIRPHYDNFIGGTWVPAVKGQTFENISPIDGHVVCTIARSTAEDVELALDAAHAAREAWGRTSPAERSLALLKHRRPDRTEARASCPGRDDRQRQADPRNQGAPICLSRSIISAISPAAFGRRKAASARSTMIRWLIISMSRLASWRKSSRGISRF